jgi:hypothetical protein
VLKAGYQLVNQVKMHLDLVCVHQSIVVVLPNQPNRRSIQKYEIREQ